MPEIIALAEVRGPTGAGYRVAYWYVKGNRLPSLGRAALTEQELEHERQRTEQAAATRT